MKREKRNGIIATVCFHAVLFCALLFLGLRTPLPIPDEEGVEVNLGTAIAGMGAIQPRPAKNTPKVKPQPKKQIKAVPQPTPKAPPKEKVVTQDTEEAPVLADKKPLQPKKKPETKKTPDKTVEEKPQPIEKKEPVKPKPVVDPRALYTGKSTNSSSGEGTSQQAGDQGQTNGTPEAKNYTGAGGAGNGISYNLGNRRAKNLPKPAYNSQEQGKVVVKILVDKNGNVIRTSIKKGTNITDPGLRKLAQEAAQKAKFTPDSNAPEVQQGEITYNFIRLN